MTVAHTHRTDRAKAGRAVKSPEEIASIYRERYAEQAALHTGMQQIRAIYHRNDIIAFPEQDHFEEASVPNLLAQGVDQMAGRVASVAPQIAFAPTKPGQRASERRADTARRAVNAWWQTDRLPLKMKQRARHLIAYAISPTTIRWNPKTGTPTWDVRDPLQAYPSPDIIPGTFTPSDCIYAYRRSIAWLIRNGYQAQVLHLLGQQATDLHPTTTLQLLEYVDGDGAHLVLTAAQSKHPWIEPYTTAIGNAATLEWAPEDIVTTVIPSRITLDRPTGQFDTMIGMYYQQAKLMALEVAAVEKGIFPDTYLVSRAGEVARFLDGPYDGRTGKVNIIAGGDIKETTTQPGYQTNPTIDRLERNQRVTAGIPAEFGGESSTNIRTGRRGDAVLSATIDFPVAEAQEIMAAALVEENKIAIALAKKYDGSTPRTFYVGVGNAARPVTFIADKVFDTDQHTVTYPAVGSDLNSLLVGIGQRVGLGTMSKWTAATLDPYIESVEFEHDRIIAEGLEQSLVAGIQQQAASGQIPPATLARIMTLVSNDRMELAEAIDKAVADAEKEAQTEQPNPAAQPTAASLTGNPDAASTVAGPNETQKDITSLMTNLRRPLMGIRPTAGMQGKV